MKFYEFFQGRRAFILFALIVILFFFIFMVNNHVEMLRTKEKYETQIEELKELVQVSNIGKEPEQEFDIYQTAEDFLNMYYGISPDVTEEYRDKELIALMTDEAYGKYVSASYDNNLDYTVTISDIHIYVDYKNSSREGVYACVFFEENTDWPNINTITVKKYWTGIFAFDSISDKWRLAEITECQELLTREEWDAFIIDTDKGISENNGMKGEDKNTDTENKK